MDSPTDVDSGQRFISAAESGSAASDLGGNFVGSGCLRSCPLVGAALTFNTLDDSTFDVILRPSSVAFGTAASVLRRCKLVTASRLDAESHSGGLAMH